MPQAKRIKAKPKKASNSKKAARTRRLDIPWGLLLVIAITGVVLAKLYYGSQQEGANFGSGLKAMFEQSQKNADEDTQAIQELVAQSSEKEFDFYDVLPDIEKVMPDDLPDSEPERAKPNLDYFVQAASFRKNADAEKLRARLALKGFKSTTQSRTSEERGTYYRVRLGPYTDKRKAKTVKNRLQKLGVSPIVLAVKRS